MKTRALLIAAGTMLCLATAQATAQVCSEIVDDVERLDCFDKAFPRSTAVPLSGVAAAAAVVQSKWRTSQQTSRIDDSTNVWLVVESNDLVSQRFGGTAPARLAIRCTENTTAVTFEFADHFMSSIDSYGTITYRIDDRQAQKKNMIESTDNSALGLWNGGSAIPFVKSLFGGNNMFVRAVPFNERPVEVEFTIAGLEEAVAPLRKACSW